MTNDLTDLLDALYASGEHLRRALDAGDTDEVAALAAARQQLAARLEGRTAPPEVMARAEAFEAQSRALADALRRHGQRFADAFDQLGRLRQARARYADPGETGPRVLDRTVRG